MKRLALILAMMVSPLMAQSPPPGITPKTVPFQIFCADSFEFLMNVLAVDFGEIPVAMGYLREGPEPTTMVWFSNAANTQSTIVVTKKSKQEESACIVWSGRSSGHAFSVNPNPDFPPEPIKKEGVEI